MVAKTGIPKRSYVAYENGESDVQLSKLRKIASILGVSISELTEETKSKTNVINQNDNLNDNFFDNKPKVKERLSSEVSEDLKVYYPLQVPKVVTVDKVGRDNVVLVPVKAAAGYLTGYSDPSFIRSLPTYNLPNLHNGTFRMFQVGGHSMYPTLHNGSYVVGEWVEDWVNSIKDNRIYVVVVRGDDEEGILVKRVLNRLSKYGHLYLKSDNRREYPNITLSPQNIIEVWEVKLYLGWELPDPATLYSRVNDLEAEIEHLKMIVNKK